jgi:hypothetical protein
MLAERQQEILRSVEVLARVKPEPVKVSEAATFVGVSCRHARRL